MMLWIVLAVLTVLAIAGLVFPLVRRNDDEEERESNIAILTRQLGEIDAQEVSGTLAPDEAEGMRTEIKRRILAEGRAHEGVVHTLDRRARPWVAVAIAAVVTLAAAGLYVLMGHPDLPAHTTAETPANANDPRVAELAAMIAKLEARLHTNPNDPMGWHVLGLALDAAARPGDAAQAYARAAALDPKTARYPSEEGEALVNVGQGQVTPAALAAFNAALKIDPNDPRARYFMALSEDQQGKHDQAMADWIALLKSAPPGAEWATHVRDFVERTARERHIDIAGKLPPASPSRVR